MSSSRRIRKLRAPEPLEFRCCLASIAFLPHELSDGATHEAQLVTAGDLDGDGYVDVVYASHDQLAWLRNDDGAGSFQMGTTVAAGNYHNVLVDDIDGDGDLDIVCTEVNVNGNFDESIVWFKNVDGTGAFGEKTLVTTRAYSSTWMARGDLDGDSDLDLIVSGYDVNKLFWYENTGGARAFTEHNLTPQHALFGSPSIADIDSDGDSDIVLSIGTIGWSLSWIENTDGTGNFGTVHPIGRASGIYLELGDLDGDGDLDAITQAAGRVTWFENVDGHGTFGLGQMVDSTQLQGVEIRDLDGDEDLDIIAGVMRSDANEVIFGPLLWYENLDANATFGPARVISVEESRLVESFGNRRQVLISADLDSDGDVDVMVARNSGISWYENRSIGDSNDDGVFDSGDLVEVFIAGKYEDGIDNNATFDEGDWDQDGDFDSGDLVLAFQSGHYEAAARPLEVEIAAAVEAVFAESDRERAKVFVP